MRQKTVPPRATGQHVSRNDCDVKLSLDTYPGIRFVRFAWVHGAAGRQERKYKNQRDSQVAKPVSPSQWLLVCVLFCERARRRQIMRWSFAPTWRRMTIRLRDKTLPWRGVLVPCVRQEVVLTTPPNAEDVAV